MVIRFRSFFLAGVIVFGPALALNTALAQRAGEVYGPSTGWLAVAPGVITFEQCRSGTGAVALWPPNAADSLIEQAKREKKFYQMGAQNYIYATVNLSYIRAKPGDPCKRSLLGVFRCATLEPEFTLHHKVDPQTCSVS